MQAAAALVVTEYLLALQFAHAAFAVSEQTLVRPWPGWHAVQAVQAEAPAADQLLPDTQLEQFVLAVTEHVAARYLPAAQVLEAQLEHGA